MFEGDNDITITIEPCYKTLCAKGWNERIKIARFVTPSPPRNGSCNIVVGHGCTPRAEDFSKDLYWKR